MTLAPGQAGRLFENLVENAYTVQSGGRLSTWLPVLDSRGIDRALSAAGGPPLFLQIKEREGRLAFQVPLAGVGTHPRWVIAFVLGTPEAGLSDCYLVPGPALLAEAPRGRMADGRECLLVTLSPVAPLGRFRVPVDRIGARLLELAGAGLGAEAGEPARERSQEEGAYFESLLTALLLRGSDRLALYRPAVDFEGRDLMVQLAGTAAAVFVQVKGTLRLDIANHPRFQVRRRTLSADPRLLFAFMAGADTAWLIPAPELLAGAAPGDPAHLSFEPRLAGEDLRWGRFRCPTSALVGRLMAVLEGGSGSSRG